MPTPLLFRFVAQSLNLEVQGRSQSTYIFDIIIIFCMRLYFMYLNRKRDAEKLASGKEYDEFGYVEHVNADGTTQRIKVPIQFMDMTDWENKAFRYTY